MTDSSRLIVQLLQLDNGSVIALANDGTVWELNEPFNAWEPAFSRPGGNPIKLPQKGEDPWL